MMRPADRKTTRRQALGFLAATAALAAAGARSPASAQISRARLAVVVKVPVSPWFDAMETEIKQSAQEYGVDAWMVRPAGIEPEYQVQAVEQLIAQKVDVLAVVPNEAAALVPVFIRARAAGIKVITHESPQQLNEDWDIELTSVEAESERTIDSLAFNMAEAGEYFIIVGSAIVPLHNALADACVAIQKAKYPKMTLIPGRFGVGENPYDSYKVVLDQIRAHPNLKGILAFGSQGPIGAARALDERGKGKQIALVGTFLPREAAGFVKEGSIRDGYFWSPILAGRTIVYIGGLLVRGQQPVDNMDVPGLGQVRVYPDRHLIVASDLEEANRRTIDELIAGGL